MVSEAKSMCRIPLQLELQMIDRELLCGYCKLPESVALAVSLLRILKPTDIC